MADFDRGSETARAVSKGQKEKELHDFAVQVAFVVSLALGVAVWFFSESKIAGVATFLVCAFFSMKWYYKE